MAISVNAIAFAELCFQLNNGEYSQKQLVDLVGVTPGTIFLWMKYLRKKKLIYVVSWNAPQTTGQYEAVWTWGFEKINEKRPRAKTQAEYCEKYRKNKRIRIATNLGRIIHVNGSVR